MKIKSWGLSKQFENQLDSVTEKPVRFLRLQGLTRDWSKHTFQEYFQRSRFSSFECKIFCEKMKFSIKGWLRVRSLPIKEMMETNKIVIHVNDLKKFPHICLSKLNA